MRNYTLDWIRLIAMIGVLTDHYICNVGCKSLNAIGLQMGGGSVTLFFLISALLFGLKWSKSGFMAFQVKPFIKNRFLRIFIPLWLSFLLIIPIEYIVTSEFEIATILCNLIGLNWAYPLVTAGHLWYITMLMILYVIFVIISRLRLDLVRSYFWTCCFAIILIAYFIFQEKITTYSKAGPPLFVFFSVLIFAKGDKMLELAKKYRVVILIATIVLVAISQYIYLFGWHDSHKAIAISSFICAGALTFLTLNSYLKITKQNKIISILAGISYEIYLVHVPLISLCRYYFDNIYAW